MILTHIRVHAGGLPSTKCLKDTKCSKKYQTMSRIAPRHITDLDLSKLHVEPCKDRESQKIAEVYLNDKREKIFFNLCRDTSEPVEARINLDDPGTGKTDRRGWGVKLEDEATLKVLRDIDEQMIQLALERSKEWWKKQYEETQIRFMYKPLLRKIKDDTFDTLKFKVKMGEPVPTLMHLREGDVVRRKAARAHDLVKGALVTPCLSMYALWITGAGFGLSIQAEEMNVTPPSSEASKSGMIISTEKLTYVEDSGASMPTVNVEDIVTPLTSDDIVVGA